MTYKNIPSTLRALPQWVVHRAKCPYNPLSGERAKAGQPETWTSFENAATANGWDGIGFEFLPENKLIGIELDTVREPETGWVDPIALDIIEKLNSYTELSPSGYGFHVIVKGTVDFSWHKAKLEPNQIKRLDVDLRTGEVRRTKAGEPKYKQPEIEMYSEGRYFTVTGNVFDGYTELTEARAAVSLIQREFAKPPSDTYIPTGYLEIGLERDNKFRQLWDGSRPHGDESSDDQALLNKLAYWLNTDPLAMVSAFKRSPHFLSKDEKHAKKSAVREDYLQRTVETAIRGCTRTAEQDNAAYNSKHPANGAKQIYDIFRPVADFDEQEAAWLIDGWLPAGQIALIASDGGVGKTTVDCEIAAAISSGTTCILDRESTQRKPGRVLFLTTEDSISKKLRKKLRKLGANLDNIFAPDPSLDVNGELRNLKFGSPALSGIIKKLKPALCILDPVQGYVPADINMGSRNAMRDCLAPLAALGEETGCTFLVVCHTNKRKGASGRDRISDSSDLWDISRSVLMAGFTGERDERYIANEKNNYAERQKTVLFRIDNGFPKFVGYSDKRDLDFVQDSMRLKVEAEPINERLVEALRAEANPFEPVRFSYETFEEKYGALVWGGKQPKRALDSVKPTLENLGYALITKKIKIDGRSYNGFILQVADTVTKQETLGVCI